MIKIIDEKKTIGFGVTSLTVSIMGFLMFIIPYIGIFFSITGIVLAVIQQRKCKTGLGTAGLVMGIIGTVSNVIWLGLVVLAVAIIGI